ncbi:MAG: zinc metallopeptidase [Candidatus Hydrogenedentes bacterium]|nr:zinc metallopeptidase [Candidatus Hydrogenedentota bacterium]
MFFFDPMYLLFLAPAIIFTIWAQNKVKGTYAKYSKVPSIAGMPGHRAAASLLKSVGMPEVEIEPVPGKLTDHYDPSKKVLRLSEGVYNDSSLAALAIVAHEAGHAIQDQVRYPFLVMRTALVPATNFGSTFGYLLIMAGMMLVVFGAGGFALQVAWAGVILFALTLVFTIVTLPVEFNASSRALSLLEANGIVSPLEKEGARKVLDAAALTYVAAMATSLLTLLYFVFRLLALGGRRD